MRRLFLTQKTSKRRLEEDEKIGPGTPRPAVSMHTAGLLAPGSTCFRPFPDIKPSGNGETLSRYSCGGSSGFDQQSYRIPFSSVIRNHVQNSTLF